MQTVRCGQCQKKLAEAQYTLLNIKCPRCGTLNLLRASAADHSSQSAKPERPRASSHRENSDDDQRHKKAH